MAWPCRTRASTPPMPGWGTAAHVEPSFAGTERATPGRRPVRTMPAGGICSSPAVRGALGPGRANGARPSHGASSKPCLSQLTGVSHLPQQAQSFSTVAILAFPIAVTYTSRSLFDRRPGPDHSSRQQHQHDSHCPYSLTMALKHSALLVYLDDGRYRAAGTVLPVRRQLLCVGPLPGETRPILPSKIIQERRICLRLYTTCASEPGYAGPKRPANRRQQN